MPSFACQPFVTVDDVLAAPCGCAFDEAADGAPITELCDEASDLLYVLSGGRYAGRCSRTVRPVSSGSGCWPVVGSSYHPALGDAIPLGGVNVEVMEVVIDGVILPPSAYRLINRKWLVRVTGSWPTTNDLTLDDTEAGTFSVTYRFGHAPGEIVKQAAVELVCTMMKDPAAINRLRGVSSANVQGVSVTTEVEGLGLPAVARFLDLYAPGGFGARGVWSPDMDNGWQLFESFGPSGS